MSLLNQLSLNEKFFKALNDGNILQIEEILKNEEFDINVYFEGKHPLIAAVWEGKSDIVRRMLAQPTLRLDAIDENGKTALMVACKENNLGKPSNVHI